MFEDAVRRRRLQDAMRREGLDAVVCSAASDVLLLSGYWPVMGMSMALLSVGGDCVIVLPEDEQEIAAGYTKDLQICYKPGTLTTLQPLAKSLATSLEQALQRLGVYSGRLGLREEITEQPSSYVVTTNFHQTVRSMLDTAVPTAVLQPCDEMLEAQKANKTEHEMSRLLAATAIVEAGFAAAPGEIDVGLSEREVAARIQIAFDTAPAASKVQRSYGSFFCMSGPNSARASAAYAMTRERVLGVGDLVMIHANTCADGFWTDVTRTYTVGTASSRQREMRKAILTARSAALEAVCPGVAARDIDRAARNVMEAHGLGEAFRHAAGHGVGFAAANAAARPRIHPVSSDILSEGSTFNLEPAAYFDGYGGMRHCDMVAVTDSGARVLTPFAEGGE